MTAVLQRWKLSAFAGVRAKPYTLLFAVLMLAVAPVFATRKASDWVIVYIPTAHHLVNGEDIYDQIHGFVYPPLQALLAVPVLSLPPVAQRLCWLAVNALALWMTLRSAWRLACGPDLESMNVSTREHVAFGLGLLVGLTYFFNSLMHQQTDILLAWLLFAGIERIQHGRGLKAAIYFGIAAAMKCTPVLFAPYLLIRGRFLAAGLVIVVAAGVNLLPDLIHSPATHSTWLAKWFDLYLAPMASADHRPGAWASAIVYNQSVIGALNRWSGTTWAIEDGKAVVTAIEPILNPQMMKAMILGLAALLGMVSLVAMIVARRRGMVIPLPWECSLVLGGMLLFSPMSSPAHFGTLLLPAFLLVRAALIERHAMAWVFVAGMLAAAYASNKDLLGGSLYTLGLWYGSVMLCAVAAVTGCWWGLMRKQNQTARSTPIPARFDSRQC